MDLGILLSKSNTSPETVKQTDLLDAPLKKKKEENIFRNHKK